MGLPTFFNGVMMSNIIVIGEALIDLIPKDTLYLPKIGGAPLNVVLALKKLNINSIFYTKLGNDYFSNLIINYLKENKIDTKRIKMDGKYNTAFSLIYYKDNNRNFIFPNNIFSYNKISRNEIKEVDFKKSKILHFCSVALKDEVSYNAHLKAIKLAKKYNLLISFDLNLRLGLYNNDLKLLKKRVNEFIKYSNIIKISDEDANILFKDFKIEKLNKFLNNNTKMILYTAGNKPTICLTKDNIIEVPTIKNINVVDTTGAGDGFIAAILANIMNLGKDISNLTSIELENMVKFANVFAGLSTTKVGASYPNPEEINDFLRNFSNNT